MRRVPFLPTLIVLAAVATMVGLGVWQLQRAQWKDALLARYGTARTLAPIDLPATVDLAQAFRFARASCSRPVNVQPVAGRSGADETGWSYVARCARAGGGEFLLDLGWSKRLLRTDEVEVPRGDLTGLIVPSSDGRWRLFPAVTAPGLEPSQVPGPDSVPNNHRAYAVQWFLFAAAALVIYALALRRRGRDTPAP